ncbi:chorismate mutase [Natronospira proteinivora]|uniref:chorismate mutase n=1 Tax=Natronospira proteinivora TaxID=1807133 RepID=A0ABT1G7B1_9GAMM|nr:chorismate mutase [Natronospira proteinivora]MCP1727185.1 chorismate mutase [Natronospira proteinivora]
MRELDIKQLRDTVDELDAQLVQLLAQRMQGVEQIQSLKRLSGQACREAEREADIIRRIHSTGRRQGLDPDWLESLFRKLFEFSERFAREEVTP